MAYGVILGQTPKQIENPNTIASNVSYNNSQTSSIITGNNVQEAIDELFTSVSNGKELVANAITDKGVVTSSTDTFATMAENIGNINVGKEVTFYTVNSSQGTYPYGFLKLPNYEVDAYYCALINFTTKPLGSNYVVVLQKEEGSSKCIGIYTNNAYLATTDTTIQSNGMIQMSYLQNAPFTVIKIK